jgi:hypothetical protein
VRGVAAKHAGLLRARERGDQESGEQGSSQWHAQNEFSLTWEGEESTDASPNG